VADHSDVPPKDDTISLIYSHEQYRLSRTVVCQVEVADGLGETLNNLLHGSCVVGTVSQDDIDVVVVQSLEGALQALNDVLLGKTTGVGLLAASTEEDLGRDDIFVSGVGKLVEGTSVCHVLVSALGSGLSLA